MSAERFKPASSLGHVRGGQTLFYGWLGPQRRLWISACNSTRIKRSCPCRSPRLSGTCRRISIALVDSVYRTRLLAHLSQAKQLPRVRLLSEKTKPTAQGAKTTPKSLRQRIANRQLTQGARLPSLGTSGDQPAFCSCHNPGRVVPDLPEVGALS